MYPLCVLYLKQKKNVKKERKSESTTTQIYSVEQTKADKLLSQEIICKNIPAFGALAAKIKKKRKKKLANKKYTSIHAKDI